MNLCFLTAYRLFFSKNSVFIAIFILPTFSWSFDQNKLADAVKQKKSEAIISLLAPEVEKLSHDNLVTLADAYFDSNNYLAAIKTYTACLAIDPKDYKSKTRIGLSQINLGKDKDALLTLKSSLEINSKFEPTYQVLVDYYTKKKNKYELRLLYQDMVDNLGEKDQYITALCELCTQDGLYEQSIKYCQKGIQLNPKSASNFSYLGLSYQETGETKKAQRFLKLAADKFPDSEIAQLNYAQLLENDKNFIQAYSYFKKATVANDKSLKGFLGLANASLEIQKYNESLSAYAEACKINRSTITAVRKATNTIRGLKNAEWAKKFDDLAEKCGNKF